MRNEKIDPADLFYQKADAASLFSMMFSKCDPIDGIRNVCTINDRNRSEIMPLEKRENSLPDLGEASTQSDPKPIANSDLYTNRRQRTSSFL
jgi:hypothetical protein